MKHKEERRVLDDAMGLFPSGHYLMTAGFDGQRSGMLVERVMRCSDEPFLLCVAARKGHKIDPMIRDSRCFALGVVGEDDRLIRRRFSRSDSVPSEFGPVGEDDPFDAIEVRTLVTGSPMIKRCGIWFDCEVLRRVDLESETEMLVGLVLGLVVDGAEYRFNRPDESAG